MEQPVCKCPYCGTYVYPCPDVPGWECENDECMGYWPDEEELLNRHGENKMIDGIYEDNPIRRRYLKLIMGEKPGQILLSVVDENGYHVLFGDLIVFDTNKQEFELCENVSHEFGLELDSRDRIVIHTGD